MFAPQKDLFKAYTMVSSDSMLNLASGYYTWSKLVNLETNLETNRLLVVYCTSRH